MNREYILSIFFIFFKKVEISSIVWYGNKQGNDTDLFVVLKDDFDFITYHIFFLDIVFVGEKRAREYALLLDPLITEPVLTGEVIYGDVDFLKEIFTRAQVGLPVVGHLLKTAHRFYRMAVDESFMGLYSEAILTLSFVQSYVVYAEMYLCGKNIVIFKDVLSNRNGRNISYMRKRFKDFKPVSDNEMFGFFLKTREMLTSPLMVV